METRPRACLTFVGDITRDSRALRFIDVLSETYNVTAITASRDALDCSYPKYRLISIPALRASSLRRGLWRFWREGRCLVRSVDAQFWVASDLYSLPVAYAGGRRNSAPLLYDSRELYSSVAALHRRPVTQKFWSMLERRYASKAAAVTTVNASIAAILRASFPRAAVAVVHNYPAPPFPERTDILRTRFSIAPGRKILLSQGGLQAGRGGKTAIRALVELPDCVLVFLGSGPLKEELRLFASACGVEERVRFMDSVRSEEVLSHTASADIGLCLIEDLGESYRLSLPNKLFEYISAGVPVVASRLPEIRAAVEGSGTGVMVDPSHPQQTAAAVRRLIDDRALYEECQRACLAAREEFSWEREKGAFSTFLRTLGAQSDTSKK